MAVEGPPPAATPGVAQLGASLRASVGQLGETLLALGRNRLALLANELEAEKRRLLSVMAWGAFGVLMGSVALVCMAALVAAAFWDTPHRLLVMGLITLVFVGLCAGAVRQVRALLLPDDGLLQASLAELHADGAAFQQAVAPSPSKERV
jgi:uncharacterized membrane protein YqjE